MDDKNTDENKERSEEFKKTHPGFEIKCEVCSSTDVYVENSLGWSELSGMWGSVELVCANCKNLTVIAGNV